MLDIDKIGVTCYNFPNRSYQEYMLDPKQPFEPAHNNSYPPTHATYYTILTSFKHPVCALAN